MKLCGFVHSIFVRRPVPVIGLFASYSAPNEWWASNGAAKHETRVKAANIPRVIILLWVLRYLTHYRRRSKQVCPCMSLAHELAALISTRVGRFCPARG